MLDQLLWFVKTAREGKGGIWLAIPSGMLTGFPITLDEYLEGLVEQGTLQRSPPELMQAVNEEPISPDAPPAAGILLASATVFSGNFTHNVGYAIVDGFQVSAFGTFSNMTTTNEGG